jgi:hypothetical protein
VYVCVGMLCRQHATFKDEHYLVSFDTIKGSLLTLLAIRSLYLTESARISVSVYRSLLAVYRSLLAVY